jgi:hypothetical protein
MEKTAIETCASWLDSHSGEMNTRGIEVERKGEAAGKAVFWLHGPQHLVDISVWNHAFCLDVLALESKTNETAFSEAGSCETSRGVRERLERFWSWYVSQQA